ncbi:hypothetical protein Kpol_1025p44 [Vanderwaltozyma polyspora DSM 70294]|uniref:Golgi to ER traffic protein 1 n=1 Tax=Vanderwaltozyma polyspora (strain ATCC 22028 / DSM 70294 / BCRC 21397 / CBS 2163 / NBRC 10782 / NRRL Y-8283 / UCD 57-17) TaxID=436907 RepID=GET1_VANPO|nr:uncharacterized protein Kpol_1025p44 [Vanderwaltozyma polyspora DSM 70294]A7TKW8.1 RecName: Full=Golgi to ER traffic protein 1; AltName: Full=Guided entry of tail-anchored proteins 1 [Vanderwaltozyma polyspora DSM 70294]EDO17123.1 hypothetical protein Kpol_1025p44 [Vanderwaltozyma polyspora DSM 70294]
MNWVIIAALFFVIINKLLQYTSRYQEAWINKFSISSDISSLSKEYSKLSAERLKIKEENQSISAQDNYARWTKNNRKLTKLEGELEKLRSNLKIAKDSQSKLFNRLKLLTLTLPFMILKLWKGKFIVYDIPTKDTFPVIVNGVLSQGLLYIPLLPINFLRGIDPNKHILVPGVSLGIWLMALTKTIDTVEFIVKQLVFQPVVSKQVKEKTKEKVVELKTTEAELD